MGRFARYENLTGRQFGNLVALNYLGNRKWSCGCKCGNFTTVEAYVLKRGHAKSCGSKCKFYGNIVDLTGMVFGKLTVLEISEEKKFRYSIWICRCDCENQTIIKVKSGDLRRGSTTSCGCKREELQPGEKIGMLTVVKKHLQDKHGRFTYYLKCDCGRVIFKSKNDIVKYKNPSCGQCNTRSERLYLEGQ